ncbi:MAG: hypothetical protein JKY07_06995 [SAR324 cluster bacterium]|jgi:hypothetical protein|nr:hypothetical protein [SAR324 cluster bacterium]
MELLKRYSISFTIAGLFLYFFTIWVEEKHEGSMPHNLSTKKGEKVAITLLPKRSYEKCVDLSPVQQLQYGFNSSAPLSFNIHFHEEGEQYYPVKEDSITELESKFRAEKRGYYCLKWGNSGSEDAKMDFHFKIINDSSDND